MKWMSLLLSLLLLNTCGSEEAAPKITLKINSNTYVMGDTLSVALKLKAKITIDSTHYYLDDTPIRLPHIIKNNKLGDHRLSATHYIQGKTVSSSRSIRLLKKKPLACGPTPSSMNIHTIPRPTLKD